jgi:hypothetical protein
VKYWQRLPISYLLAMLILALTVPFAHSDDNKKAAQQAKPSQQPCALLEIHNQARPLVRKSRAGHYKLASR